MHIKIGKFELNIDEPTIYVCGIGIIMIILASLL